MRFLLLHSPLITKETWIALAIALEGAGFEATVISFDNVASEGESYHRHHISQAQPFISKVGDEKVIAVAHSGSGNILALFDPDSVDAYVFLDAMFPIVEASRFDLFDDPASIEGWRKVARENNGMLPRSMLARFGSQITDDGLRSTFIGALSDVPIALYEEKTPVHPEWPPVKPGLYVQWTDAYTMDAARAKGAGFDVLVDLASHFRMLNQPEEVARTLIDFGKALE